MYFGPSRLWRIAALALLLCAAFDVLAVDTALWNCCDGSSTNENCFCCCTHAIALPPAALAPFEAASAFVDLPVRMPESAPVFIPELPPRV